MLGSMARGFSLHSCRTSFLTSLTCPRPLSTSCSLPAKRKFPVGALKFRPEQQELTTRTKLAPGQKVARSTKY